LDHYAIGDVEFAVRSTDRRFLDVLRAYLAPFHAETGPSDILFSADCGIERHMGGNTHVVGVKRLFFNGVLLFRGRGMEEMAARLISGFRDWTNNQSNEFFRLRAGSIALEGGAMLLPSNPSIELSALVGLLIRDGGAGYIGDEITNVDPILRRAHGTGLPLLIDAERVSLFPEVAATPPQPARRRRRELPMAARPRRPVLLQEIGGTPAPPTEIRWIVLPEFRPGEPTRLENLPKAEAMFRLTEAALNLHIWSDRAFGLMQDLIAQHLVGRAVIGDLAGGARFLVDLVANEAPRT
jgi:hypothetical protein